MQSVSFARVCVPKMDELSGLFSLFLWGIYPASVQNEITGIEKNDSCAQLIEFVGAQRKCYGFHSP
jgi:hypothetical protein